MARRIIFPLVTAFALLLFAYLVWIPAHAQTSGLPISGTVLDPSGRPVANANVMLIRSSGQSLRLTGHQTLAQGVTDASGKFALGSVALNTDVSFPQETQVSWDYVVMSGNTARTVQRVSYTAPRTNSVVSSVSAEIHIQ